MVGKNLARILRDRKISRGVYAEYMGVSRGAVQRWVHEDTFMTEDAILKTADFLGISPATLFQDSEPDNVLAIVKAQQTQLNEMMELIKLLVGK